MQNVKQLLSRARQRARTSVRLWSLRVERALTVVVDRHRRGYLTRRPLWLADDDSL